MTKATRDYTNSVALTLAACSTLAVGAGFAIWLLTGGFQHWTFDSLRHDHARSGRMSVLPIELSNFSGETVSPWSRQGPRVVYVVDFIYTRCESVCSVLGSEFQQMQARLMAARPGTASPRLLSISFDPRDTLEDLSRYAERYHVAKEVWDIARPNEAGALSALLRQLWVVVVPDGRNDFVHNGALSIVDSAGRVHAVFDYASWESALACASAVAGGSHCVSVSLP